MKLIIELEIILIQYSAEISQLAERAKCLVRDLDPTNQLTFVRIASKKHEVSIFEDTFNIYRCQN